MKYLPYLWNVSLVLVSFGTKDVPKPVLRVDESRNHNRIENYTLPKAVRFPHLFLDFVKSSVQCTYWKRIYFIKNWSRTHKYFYYGSNRNYIYECTVNSWYFQSSEGLVVNFTCSSESTPLEILLKEGIMQTYACLDHKTWMLGD